MNNKQLKILISIPWFYPAYRAGGPVQSIVNLVGAYTGEVSFYVFTGNTDLNGESLNIQENQWVQFNDHTKVWYCSPKRGKESFQKICKSIQPDILYINGMFSWTFTLVPLIFSKVPKKVISPRGMLHPEALAVKPFKKRVYFRIWKCLHLHKGVHFHATDQAEFEHIQNFFGKITPVTIALNYPRTFNHMATPYKCVNQLLLVSIGLISPMKNYLEVCLGLQHVQAKIEYHIYGPIKDMVYWKKCLSVIQALPSNIQVVYHGSIGPNEIESALAEGHVFILPSKSENYGHAIIEALSIGRPVITSKRTPWNALESYHAGMNIEPDPLSISAAIDTFAKMSDSDLKVFNEGASRYAGIVLDIQKIKLSYAPLFN